MNEHDQKNLNFLLNISPEVFQDWLAQADLDDVCYAMELLNSYSQTLFDLALAEAYDVEIDDLSQAENVIKQIKSKLH